MKTIISEHNVDLDVLPVMATILDLGCRGFLFSNHFKELGHRVISVDCDDLDGDYFKAAITNYDGYCGIIRNSDPQATTITTEYNEDNKTLCYTLETFTKNQCIEFWDLIKMDIEGNEYQVIMSLTGQPSRQLSIEFHLHTGIYTEKEVTEMVDKLKSLGYNIVSHELTEQHGAGFNYWSSLFIAA